MAYTPIDLNQIAPISYKNGPVEGFDFPPGRLFEFQTEFQKAGIYFDTDILTLATAIGRLTGFRLVENGIYHPCTCNGPHHALFVANFSKIVLGEMLNHPEMMQRINQILKTLSPEASFFLTQNNYQNYFKLVQMVSLLHDTGRPTDDYDKWDASNEINVMTNIQYLLSTARLSPAVCQEILAHIQVGMANKSELDLETDEGLLFGGPLGAGDALHSGHAFRGGKWGDDFEGDKAFKPRYVRVFSQYPDFQNSFLSIVNEVENFVPLPTEDKLAAVKPYLAWNQYDGDGTSIIKYDFAQLIQHQFESVDNRFPIIKKYFGRPNLVITPAPEQKEVSIPEQKVDLRQLKPLTPNPNPPSYIKDSGRLFQFGPTLEQTGINFNTDITVISHALASLISQEVDEDFLVYPYVCNGPYYSFFTAKLASMFAGAMLEHQEMRARLNTLISSFSPQTQHFLTENNYKNYKKLIECITLLYNTGRPEDGPNKWENTNHENVFVNIEYFLLSAGCTRPEMFEILGAIAQGLTTHSQPINTDYGLLFGGPLGAGIGLFSGLAFHGGAWKDAPFDPNRVRLYSQYPEFQATFQQIVQEASRFIPSNQEDRYAAIRPSFVVNTDKESLVKRDFAEIIQQQCNSLNVQEYPILAKHLSSRKTASPLVQNSHFSQQEQQNFAGAGYAYQFS